MSDRLISRTELKNRFGLTVDRVTLWRMERDGRFPRHVRISDRRNAWFESEIVAYLEKLKADRGGEPIAEPCRTQRKAVAA